MKKLYLTGGVILALGLFFSILPLALAQSVEVGSLPPEPTIISPVQDAKLNDNTPLFTWENYSVADNYELWIDNDSDFSSPEIKENTQENTYEISFPGLPDGDYNWRVIAYKNGQSSSSRSGAFQIDTLMPTLVSPSSGEILSENRPVFTWENIVVTDNYELQIDDSSGFSNSLIYDNEGIVDNRYRLPDGHALDDGVYYWRVRGRKDGRVSVFSSISSFRVDTLAPDIPQLVYPENGAVINNDTPSLEWRSVSENSNPVRYHIQIDNDPDFTSINIENSWQLDNCFSPDLSDGTWYWRVFPKDNVGNIGESSNPFSFTVDVAMPTLISPKDNVSLNDNKPVFKWDNLVPADNFEIWIDNNPSFSSSSLVKENLSENVFDNSISGYPENGFHDGLWFWKVRSFTPDNSHFTETWNVFVDTEGPAEPSLNSPSDETYENDNTPILDWDPCTDESSEPVLYRCYVSDNSDFPYDNYDSGWISDDNFQISNQMEEGIWFWRVQAKDNAGNLSENSSSRSFHIDVTPPTILNVAVEGLGQHSATIEWTTNEPADSLVEYGESSSYGFSENKSSLVTSHSVTLSQLVPDNTYHFRVVSTDEAGNAAASSENQFTTPDFDPPTSSIDHIPSYWCTENSLTIEATASDNDGSVDNVSLYYRYRENSNLGWGSWTIFGKDNSSPWEWSFDSPEDDGCYEFYTLAVDSDNLVENAPLVADENAGFDTTPPSISSVLIDEGATTTNSVHVTLSVTARDSTSGVKSMRFSCDGDTWTSWENFDNERDYSFGLPEGSKTVHAQVKDYAGLISDVATDSIILENATFTITLGSMSENTSRLANFSEWDLSVKQVRFYAGRDISSAKVSLRVSDEKPGNITDVSSGIVFYYFNLETDASTDDIDKIMVEFDVRKSWLDNHDLGIYDVKSWKFDGDWEYIPVTVMSENASHVRYSTTFSSLSWFAVSGEGPDQGIRLIWVILVAILAIVVIVGLWLWWEWSQARSGIPNRGL